MSLSLNEHVRRVVAEAIRQDSVLYIAPAARALASAHSDEGLCTKAVAEMLVEAGIHARISLEIDTSVPKRPQCSPGD
jgi:hypothetical protein